MDPAAWRDGGGRSHGGDIRRRRHGLCGRDGAILKSGEAGRDALAGLGLSPGFIGPTSGDDARTTYGVELPNTLHLATTDAAKRAGEAVLAAMKVVRDAYRDLKPKDPLTQAVGQAPAYMTARIANYQAALARLTGG